MKSLDDLPAILDEMISSQKEKKSKTYVAKYKGKNITVRSGKSSWKAVNHAKAAIIQHFSYREEREYKYYDYVRYETFDYKLAEKREKEFRAKLWELIEIVELV